MPDTDHLQGPPDLLAALRPRDPESDHFGHLDHVHLAWVMVGRYGADKAAEVLCTLLPLALRNAGEPAEKFHDTLTRAWTALVASAMDHSDVTEFDDLLAARPELADKALLRQFYSDELLFSERARAGFVQPDLRALPGITS